MISVIYLSYFNKIIKKTFMKKTFWGVLCLVLFIIIFYEPKVVTDGVKTGIDLCLYRVIPSLMPFILITNIILNKNLGNVISRFFYPLLHKIYGVTKSGCFAMIISYMSGFPVGAGVISHLYETSHISKKEACHLMTYCNNCSISFTINYLGIYCLKECVDFKLLLLLIYAPPLITGFINRPFFQYTSCNPQKNNPKKNIISSTLLTLGKISVFVICFSIIVALLQNTSISYAPKFSILLEITTGLSEITRGILSPSVICTAVIGTVFGGFCTMFQAFSLIKNTVLKKYYIIGKMEQIIISALILIIF